jgi:hypothetical protein
MPTMPKNTYGNHLKMKFTTFNKKLLYVKDLGF